MENILKESIKENKQLLKEENQKEPEQQKENELDLEIEEKEEFSIVEKIKEFTITLIKTVHFILGFKGRYFLAILFLSIILKLFGVVTNSICKIISRVIPTYWTLRSLRDDNTDKIKIWLTYWGVYFTFNTFDQLSFLIIKIFPFYDYIKIIFLIWLSLPDSNGPVVIYESIIKNPYNYLMKKTDKYFNEEVNTEIEEKNIKEKRKHKLTDIIEEEKTYESNEIKEYKENNEKKEAKIVEEKDEIEEKEEKDEKILEPEENDVDINPEKIEGDKGELINENNKIENETEQDNNLVNINIDKLNQIDNEEDANKNIINNDNTNNQNEKNNNKQNKNYNSTNFRPYANPKLLYRKKSPIQLTKTPVKTRFFNQNDEYYLDKPIFKKQSTNLVYKKNHESSIRLDSELSETSINNINVKIPEEQNVLNISNSINNINSNMNNNNNINNISKNYLKNSKNTSKELSFINILDKDEKNDIINTNANCNSSSISFSKESKEESKEDTSFDYKKEAIISSFCEDDFVNYEDKKKTNNNSTRNNGSNRKNKKVPKFLKINYNILKNRYSSNISSSKDEENNKKKSDKK